MKRSSSLGVGDGTEVLTMASFCPQCIGYCLTLFQYKGFSEIVSCFNLYVVIHHVDMSLCVQHIYCLIFFTFILL